MSGTVRATGYPIRGDAVPGRSIVGLAVLALLGPGAGGCHDLGSVARPCAGDQDCAAGQVCGAGHRCVARDHGQHGDARVTEGGPVADHGASDRSFVTTDADGGPLCHHPSVSPSCRTDSAGMVWCTVPAGCFTMGSPTSEGCRDKDETLHQVTLTRGFEITKTEVTQAQFKALMGYNPQQVSSVGSGGPAETVTWHEAAACANAVSGAAKLPQKSWCYDCKGSGSAVICSEAAAYAGKQIYACPGVRLPTEAEWEYAYRAGQTTALYNGATTGCACKDDNLAAIGWVCAGESALVGQKKANGWGLVDMAGNVWEWCHDPVDDYPVGPVTDPVGSSGSDRIRRGGSWNSQVKECRAAYRGSESPDFSSPYGDTGFRLARSLP